MNNKILQKCVDELQKESPKIDYVLGMLESVIEMTTTSTTYTGHGYATPTPGYGTVTIPLGIPTGTATTKSTEVDEEGSGLLKTYLDGPIATLKQ